jgi:hypothetical protein
MKKQAPNPIEIAHDVEARIKTYKLLHGTLRGAAISVSKKMSTNRSTLNAYRQLLTLDENIQSYIISGLITFTNARLLCSAPKEFQLELARSVAIKGMSHKDLKSKVSRLREGDSTKDVVRPFRLSGDVERHIEGLEEVLGVIIDTSGLNTSASIIIKDWGFDSIKNLVALHSASTSNCDVNIHFPCSKNQGEKGYMIKFISSDLDPNIALKEGVALLELYKRYLARKAERKSPV